jgi:hypothetical protein
MTKADRAAIQARIAEFPRGEQEARFIRRLGAEFKTRHTPHFFLMYDTDDVTVKDFLWRIEATFRMVHYFARHLDVRIYYPKEKLAVVFCRDFEAFDQAGRKLGGGRAERGVCGYFVREGNYSIFHDAKQEETNAAMEARASALRKQAASARDPATRRELLRQADWYANTAKARGRDHNQEVVQHEIAHQLLWNLGVHKAGAANPGWLVEGLATLFETPPASGGAGLAVVNPDMLGRLREAAREGRLIPLARLVPTPRMFIEGNPDTDLNYAHAWGLSYFLYQTKLPALRDYIELIKSRQASDEITPDRELADFEKCFGKLDERFEKRWLAFLLKLPHRPRS